MISKYKDHDVFIILKKNLFLRPPMKTTHGTLFRLMKSISYHPHNDKNITGMYKIRYVGIYSLSYPTKRLLCSKILKRVIQI